MNGRIAVVMDIDKLCFGTGFRKHDSATEQRVQVKLHLEPWMVAPGLSLALVLPIAVVRA